MAITTDFIGHIGIEPALSDDEIERLAALHGAAREYGAPRLQCGWVADKDGRRLTHNGDERCGDPAEWLRHLIKFVVKPSGLRAEGMVVGCRRETNELWSVQVSGNRVTERGLWPRSAQPREARRQPPSRKPTAQVIDLATRRAGGR